MKQQRVIHRAHGNEQRGNVVHRGNNPKLDHRDETRTGKARCRDMTHAVHTPSPPHMVNNNVKENTVGRLKV